MPIHGKTLLIVDDEESIHRALQRTLRREPYRLLHAHDAAEAWALLQQHPDTDGVMSDHYMPGTTGLQLLIDVRLRFPHIVTVLLTAQADLQLVINAINQGHIHRFLTKPWDADQLRHELRMLLHLGPDGGGDVALAARTERQLQEELLPERDEESGAFIIEAPDLEVT